MRKYFGTDGVRGKVGVHPMTPDFVMRLGYAAGKILARNGGKVLIGKDTRISGYMFESALEAGFTYAGAEVALIGPMPTPGIAYLTQTLDMVAGCVVSASHNPFYDNGIKFFDENGRKLPDEVELEIERYLDAPFISAAPYELGRVRRINDAAGRYIEFCKSSARDLSLKGVKVVLDCANGATYHIAPHVFRELGAEVIVIGNEPDGFNINRDVGSTAPKKLIETVLKERANCGIAFDGDGDRLLIVDELGNPFDGDDILYILAKYREEKRIVGTVMSNLGFEASLAESGISLIRSNVGDRYVLEELNKNNLLLGGENSGHIICLDKHGTGDGIIAALQALRAVIHHDTTFSKAVSDLKKTKQVMINVGISKGDDWKSSALSDEIASVEQILKHEGRVLIRPSGTEPVVRVMVEGHDIAQCEQLAQRLATVIESGS